VENGLGATSGKKWVRVTLGIKWLGVKLGKKQVRVILCKYVRGSQEGAGGKLGKKQVAVYLGRKFGSRKFKKRVEGSPKANKRVQTSSPTSTLYNGIALTFIFTVKCFFN